MVKTYEKWYRWVYKITIFVMRFKILIFSKLVYRKKVGYEIQDHLVEHQGVEANPQA